jgi:replicative DNA helicase
MTTYTFDESFQKKVLAMMLRDNAFTQRVEGLIVPAYFDTNAHGWLADLVNRHYASYRQVPSGTIVLNEVRKARDSKLLKPELLDEVKDALKFIYGKPDLSNRDYTVEAVSAFALERALEEGLLKSVDLLEKGAFAEIREVMAKACDTGSHDDLTSLDLGASVTERVDARVAKMAGIILPSGITTGHTQLDKELYNTGWGRKELSCLMGGPKSGKSIGLQYFAVKAAEVGNNVLFVTCENSAEITADRMDANIANVDMKELGTNAAKVEAAVKSFNVKAGALKVHEYPTKTFRPSDLRRLLRRYQSQSIIFDLVVVDYADIMASDTQFSDERFRLADIYGSLRAIAQEENLAMLTATQTNREGAKANTAGKTDVAESIDKTRLVDILISINADADEKARGEARLFFAASRNSEDEIGFRIKSDRSKMRFITKIIERF